MTEQLNWTEILFDIFICLLTYKGTTSKNGVSLEVLFYFWKYKLPKEGLEIFSNFMFSGTKSEIQNIE